MCSARTYIRYDMLSIGKKTQKTINKTL